MLSFKEKLAKNYINAVGWKTNQKYLLIESDDWGAVRMPSKTAYDEILKNQIAVDKLHIDKYDAVESNDDLKALYQALGKFQDKKGNPAILTAFFVVANPDFEKIEASGKKEYHLETILQTYQKTKHTQQVPALIKEGMQKGLLMPQFHGREHIHVKRWMEAINSSSEKEKIAFEQKAIISSKSTVCKKPYPLDYFKGFDYESENEFSTIEAIHQDGLKIFKEIFGIPSISFMAQGSVWGDHLLEMLSSEGVQLICGQQQVPDFNHGYKTVNKNWGVKNSLGQTHWRRNCMFEPARNQNAPWVQKCLAEIEIAFRWGKPAVISAHRENFIGSIFEENRNNSLEKLEDLLSLVLKKWPDVQFISTAQLAEIMLNQQK